MNIVMTASNRFVEVQGTAEEEPFSSARLQDMLKLAKKGIAELIALQEKAYSS
jgi:ribonuclease PH